MPRSSATVTRFRGLQIGQANDNVSPPLNWRRGLWRLVKTSNPTGPVTDEIISPFDATARFRFYVLNSDAAQDSVPASLNDVRGLELVLAGSSPQKFSDNSTAKRATMVTGVFFKNRRDP